MNLHVQELGIVVHYFRLPPQSSNCICIPPTHCPFYDQNITLKIQTNPFQPSDNLIGPHFHPVGGYKMNHASNSFTCRQGLPHPDRTPPSFKSHHRCQCPLKDPPINSLLKMDWGVFYTDPDEHSPTVLYQLLLVCKTQ